MLIQEYLRSGGSLETLKQEKGIETHRHPTLPLVGFNYSQTESAKCDPLIMECRGLALEEGSWDIVALPFTRFFNYGEALEITSRFDWSRFEVSEKHDGSLMILFNYRDQWCVKTRRTFGEGRVPYPPLDRPDMTFEELFRHLTWEDLFRQRFSSAVLPKHWTYCFELCSLHNKVIRVYREPVLYLLAIFDNRTCNEIQEPDTLRYVNWSLGASLTRRFHIDMASGIDSMTPYLQEEERTGTDHEGFVLRDSHGLRLKVKTQTYMALHRLQDSILMSPRGLLPFALADDKAAVVGRFPEFESFYDGVRTIVSEAWERLVEMWKATCQEPDQKTFALSIVGKTPFAGLLFDLRKKRGQAQTLEALQALWRDASDYVFKALFKGKAWNVPVGGGG